VVSVSPLSLRLAEWLAALAASAIPEPQRALARMRLLDTTGLLLGACAFPPVAIVRARAQRGSAAGRSSVIGGAATVQSEWAALANGVVAHSLDFDDTFPQSVVHPGSVIVPVALAVGEELDSAPDDLLAALAGGYEIAARLARAGGTEFHARGFHASGIFAPMVAAYTAARLMRLSTEAMAGAAGLAASMSGGLLAFIADGAWSKWLHLGWGGFGGILAAKLAQDGFRGPMGALDGRYNLYAAFIGGTQLDGVDADLGALWLGDTALFKYYPCAHVIQPYIDIALDLRRAHAIDPAAVGAVRCWVAPWAVPIVCEPAEKKIEPKTSVEAIASLRYNVAVALCHGRIGLEALEEANWRRADVLALSRSVTYVADPALSGFAARLEIELRDGRRFEQKGDASALDAVRLGEKFRALAGRALAADGVAGLERAVANFAAPEIGAWLRRALH
jgi:2-methylcitrate dehydratase PrpD